MGEDQKIYHFDEVSKHSATEDCWLIIHGKISIENFDIRTDVVQLYEKVYDVTPFIDEHPGGDEVLLAATRKNATNDFEDVGHSETARNLMEKYCIGKIDNSTVPAVPSFVMPPPKPYKFNKTEFTFNMLQFLVPIMILGLAFAVKYYYTRAE